MSSNIPKASSDEVPADLHTAEEISAFLKVDPKTVLNWAKTGIMQFVFIGNRANGFNPASRLHGDVGFEFGGRSGAYNSAPKRLLVRER